MASGDTTSLLPKRCYRYAYKLLLDYTSIDWVRGQHSFCQTRVDNETVVLIR